MKTDKNVSYYSSIGIVEFLDKRAIKYTDQKFERYHLQISACETPIAGFAALIAHRTEVFAK
jgi:hypothetical protein